MRLTERGAIIDLFFKFFRANDPHVMENELSLTTSSSSVPKSELLEVILFASESWWALSLPVHLN